MRLVYTGQVIGTDSGGVTTKFLRVVVDATGKVITAYPLPQPVPKLVEIK